MKVFVSGGAWLAVVNLKAFMKPFWSNLTNLQVSGDEQKDSLWGIFFCRWLKLERLLWWPYEVKNDSIRNASHYWLQQRRLLQSWLVVTSAAPPNDRQLRSSACRRHEEDLKCKYGKSKSFRIKVNSRKWQSRLEEMDSSERKPHAEHAWIQPFLTGRWRWSRLHES